LILFFENFFPHTTTLSEFGLQNAFFWHEGEKQGGKETAGKGPSYFLTTGAMKSAVFYCGITRHLMDGASHYQTKRQEATNKTLMITKRRMPSHHLDLVILLLVRGWLGKAVEKEQGELHAGERRPCNVGDKNEIVCHPQPKDGPQRRDNQVHAGERKRHGACVFGLDDLGLEKERRMKNE